MYHNSHDPNYRAPFGAIERGQRVTIRARAERPVTLRIWTPSRKEIKLPMEKKADLWEASFVCDQMGLYWYYFIVGDEIFCAPPDKLGGQSVRYSGGELHSHQVTCYEMGFTAPKWLSTGVCYQIFPDRFYDGKSGAYLKTRSDILTHEKKDEPPFVLPDAPHSHVLLNNDFYGGNLPGIESKLDYLQKLGVTVLYLNPIFRAGSNHRYDTGDYKMIDPVLGDEADFTALCAAAKARGIRVILDGVFSHTGADSRYFNKYENYEGVGAYQSEDSPYRSWYTFIDYPKSYECWWGFDTLPNVREMDKNYLDFIIRSDDSVIAHWLRAGASGWRLDVADELPDEFIELLRARVKQIDPDACVIGEVWEDASNKVSYEQLRSYALGKGLDSVMNYPLREALLQFFLGHEDAYKFVRRIKSLQQNYPTPLFYSLMNLMGTHDRSRVINILGGWDRPDLPLMEQRRMEIPLENYTLGVKRLKKMFALLCHMPGMPTVYYGDEAGMTGMADPLCRGYFPWGRQDSELTGFFARTIAYRREHPVLQGGFMDIEALDADTVCIRRYAKAGRDVFGDPAAYAPLRYVVTREI